VSGFLVPHPSFVYHETRGCRADLIKYRLESTRLTVETLPWLSTEPDS
jgi:hypothetical protein